MQLFNYILLLIIILSIIGQYSVTNCHNFNKFLFISNAFILDHLYAIDILVYHDVMASGQYSPPKVLVKSLSFNSV